MIFVLPSALRGANADARALSTEEALPGMPVAEAVEKIGELPGRRHQSRDSWRASKEFRLQLIKEMSKRPLLEAARRGGAEL